MTTNTQKQRCAIMVRGTEQEKARQIQDLREDIASNGWQKGCKHPRYQSENGKHICQTCGLDVTALAIERDGLTVAFLSDAQCDDSGKGQPPA